MSLVPGTIVPISKTVQKNPQDTLALRKVIICRIPLSEQDLAIVGLGSGEAQRHPRLTRAGRAPLSCPAPPWGSQEPAESPSPPGRPTLTGCLVHLPLPPGIRPRPCQGWSTVSGRLRPGSCSPVRPPHCGGAPESDRGQCTLWVCLGRTGQGPPITPDLPSPPVPVKTLVTGEFSSRRSPLCLPCPTEGEGQRWLPPGGGGLGFISPQGLSPPPQPASSPGA